MMIELRHVRYFLALAEEQNFTRAAERCGIQQPPLSRQIRDMEEFVGARLFHRIPQGAVLTEAGQAFVAVVQHIPAQLERAMQEARRASRGEIGSLRLGYPGGAAFNPVVTGAIRSFRRRYPDVELELDEANTPSLAQGVEDGIYDVVFLRPGVARSENVQEQIIVEEPMIAVIPSSHTLADREELCLSDLKDDSFILMPPKVGPIILEEIRRACREAGFEPRLGQFAPQIGSVINLVAAEMGVSVVPECMSCLQKPGVVFRVLCGNAPIARLSVAHRRGDNRSPLRNFLRDLYASLNNDSVHRPSPSNRVGPELS
jgi:DNA-binding transcriptional LysR family regulator